MIQRNCLQRILPKVEQERVVRAGANEPLFHWRESWFRRLENQDQAYCRPPAICSGPRPRPADGLSPIRSRHHREDDNKQETQERPYGYPSMPPPPHKRRVHQGRHARNRPDGGAISASPPSQPQGLDRKSTRPNSSQ